MKPTYGRVSRYGLIAFGSSLDCPGPLARSVTDAALMLNAIAGPDAHDSTAAAVRVPDYTQGLEESLRGLRVGLSPDYFRITYIDAQTGALAEQLITGEIKQAVLDAAQRLAGMGAEIVEDVPMPHTRYGIPVYFVISRVEAASNLHRYDGVKYGYRTPQPVQDLAEMYRKTRAEGFGLQPKLRILMGMYVSAAQYSEQYYNRALKVRTLIRQDFERAFENCDLIVTPTAPTTAFKLGEKTADPLQMYLSDIFTISVNLAGLPGLVVPCGYDNLNLPIGLQILGPHFGEEAILRAGDAYERSGAFKRRPPAV